MQPHPGVPRCNPGLLGEAADAEAVEIDPAKRRAILRLEGVHEGRDAGARHGLELLIRWAVSSSASAAS
jgi:hypothetical protein